MSNNPKIYNFNRILARKTIANFANTQPVSELTILCAELVQEMDKNNLKKGK